MAAQTQAQPQPQSQALNHQTMSQRELRAFQEWGPSTIHVRSSSPPKNPVQNQNQGQGQGQSRAQVSHGNGNANSNANANAKANPNAPKQVSQTTHRRRNGRHNRARANSIFDEWKAQATQEDSKGKSNGATGDNNVDPKNNNADGSSKTEVLSKKETGAGTTGGFPAVSSGTGPGNSTVSRSEGQSQATTGSKRPGKHRRNSQAQRSSGTAPPDGPKKAVNGKNSGVAASAGVPLPGSSTAADSRSQSGKDSKDTLSCQRSSGSTSTDNGSKKVSGQESSAVDSAGLSVGSSGLPAGFTARPDDKSTAVQLPAVSGSDGAKNRPQPGRERKDYRASQQSSASADNEAKKVASNRNNGGASLPGIALVNSTDSRPDNQPAAVAGPRSQSGRDKRDSHARQKSGPTSTTNGPKKTPEKDATTSVNSPVNSTAVPSETHSAAGKAAVFPGSEKANGHSQPEKNYGKDTRQGVSRSGSAKDESKKLASSKNSSTNPSTSSSARSSYSAPPTSTSGRPGGPPVSEEAKGRSQSKTSGKNTRREAPESVSTKDELKNAVGSKESATVTSARSSAASNVGRSDSQPVVPDSKKPETHSQSGSGSKDSHSCQESESKKVVSKESGAGSPDGSGTLPAGPNAATTGSRSQAGKDEKDAHVQQRPEYVPTEEKKVVSSKKSSAASFSTRLSANAPSFVPGSSIFCYPHGQPGTAPGSGERDSRSQPSTKDAGQGTSVSISTENTSTEAVRNQGSGVAIAGPRDSLPLNSTTDRPGAQPTVTAAGSDNAENCSQPEDEWKDCRTCQDSGPVSTDDAPKKAASSKESNIAVPVGSSATSSNLPSVRSPTGQFEGQSATVASPEGEKNCPQPEKDSKDTHAHQGSSDKDQDPKNKTCPLPPNPNEESINRRVSASPDKKSEKRMVPAHPYSAQDVRSQDYQAPDKKPEKRVVSSHPYSAQDIRSQDYQAPDKKSEKRVVSVQPQYSAQDVRSQDCQGYQAPNGTFINSKQLARLSEGVKIPPKHTVYFLPCFIEDPWKGVKPVMIDSLSRFWKQRNAYGLWRNRMFMDLSKGEKGDNNAD